MVVVCTVMVSLLSACTVNVGSSTEPQPGTPQTPAQIDLSTTTSAAQVEVDPVQAWSELGDAENSYSQSELSQLEFGLFGLMAAPSLRLFKFVGSTWQEVTDEYKMYFALPAPQLTYDITIQSVKLTDDDAIDFVVNFRVAPWDVLRAENQGRDFGTVLSGQGGLWRSVAFWDPYNDQREYTSVEHIEFFDGVLFGSGYGSCGRPCGLLIFNWVAANNRLEGVEAEPAQRDAFTSDLNCVDFTFNENFPIGLCNEGRAVQFVQEILVQLGYILDADGYLGKESQFALQYFQRTKGLRATGVIDEPTWRLMFQGVTLPGNDLNGDGYVAPNELSGT